MRQEKSYIKIYEQIKSGIISGAYPYGTKIPSKRNCAVTYGVSIITVEHAYELLIQEGYIEPRLRSGYIVSFRDSDGFAVGTVESNTEMPFVHEEISYAYPDTLFPYSVIAKAMRRVISDYDEAILMRSPAGGSPELRGELAKYLERNRGFRVNPEQIIIGAGSEYLYGLIVELIGSKKIYGVEMPSYKKIEQVYQSRGVMIEHLALGHDGISSDALVNSDADVLHVTPYRSYPTGVTASASKRREYLTWAESGERYIIEDDFESEITPLRKPEETLFAASRGEKVIYVNTFSRTISPALRVGYMVLPQSLLDMYEDKLGFYSCTVPLFEQLLIARLISNGDFERHINRLRRASRNQE
ncbi:MAG: PLP-dependent aminotransferase family protein [Saccharofermentans sp.]|nr:PLP-dependent aminotransferase family protein [Saccharofermentans sp.]